MYYLVGKVKYLKVFDAFSFVGIFRKMDLNEKCSLVFAKKNIGCHVCLVCCWTSKHTFNPLFVAMG